MSRQPSTVHHSRTIMFKELSDVMAQAHVVGSYDKVLNSNAAGKRTKSNLEKTNRFLKQLYSLDSSTPLFKSFLFFWDKATHSEQPLLALLFALNNDSLLTQSIELIENTSIGNRAKVDDFEELIEKEHPERYSVNTRKSMGQNLASSWKQAGYLQGKIKNVRVEPKPTHLVVAFALLMSYLNGDRGQFVMESKWVKALCLPQEKVKELAFEAAKRDLVKIQSAGAVLTITFDALFNQIGINEVED